jgi:hypothetical protein
MQTALTNSTNKSTVCSQKQNVFFFLIRIKRIPTAMKNGRQRVPTAQSPKAAKAFNNAPEPVRLLVVQMYEELLVFNIIRILGSSGTYRTKFSREQIRVEACSGVHVQLYRR